MVFPTKPQGFIFDMDGLLIDSEPLWRRAEISILETVGVALTDELCKETMGTRLDEMVAYWYDRYPWTGKSQGEIGREILARVTSLIATEGEPLPGVVELLDQLVSQNENLGLASSSPCGLIEAVLDRLDLGQAFGVVCSAVDEKLGKPDPGVYLTTARKMGVEPHRCVAFEDSPAGVASAKAAGLWVVGVSRELEAGKLSDADLVLSSLEEVVNRFFTAEGRGPGADE